MPNSDRLSKEDNERFDEEARILREVQNESWPRKIKTYFQLSGPGWLQSALTLGGGSLASGLYLGVLTGVSMLWLQPLAMFLGIIMLAALGYVTLATDQRPLYAIIEHINPVLGWGWAIGSILACLVWVMPQYALANAVVQQNLLPGYFGPEAPLGDFESKLIISTLVLAVVSTVVWSYGKSSKGVKIFEMLLKGVVALIILAFFGVVIRLVFAGGEIDWGSVFVGFIPNPALIFRPAEGFAPLLGMLPEVSAEFWSSLIVSKQQEVMAAAVSTAVGINATFLFAYSMLRRKWGTEYQGMMKFDLATGMLLPFILVTSCVIIASTSQFHMVPQAGFVDQEEVQLVPSQQHQREFQQMLEDRVVYEYDGDLSEAELATQVEALGEGDRRMAATLITRDAFDLASSLQPLLGGIFSSIIFGIGVLGMALSTITLHMIITGFVICEIMKVPYDGWAFKIGMLIPAVGVLGPFFWNQALFWLAIPTSVITLMLLPIAYVAFFLMINNKAIMGEHRPTGNSRIMWNVLMITVILLVGLASTYMLWQYGGLWGIAALVLFLGAIGVSHWQRRKVKTVPDQRSGS